ncbi:sigma-70 family RNA polymerase sigma factor [bacterium]|nr:sigma-70 family RNA polymerase sigma factor [bacterium]
MSITTARTNLNPPSDQVLIDQFLKGSHESFAELVNRYQTKVFHLAMRLTRNQEDAEEVLQEVFVTIFRKLDSFQGNSAFSSWLYRITANCAFMLLRRRKVRMAMSLDDSRLKIETSDELIDRDYTVCPDERTLGSEIRSSLSSAIEKLPVEYRTVFVMRDMDGLSNEETADALGITVPAVKSRLHRSRLMLRKRLRKVYDSIRAVESRSVLKAVA